MAVKISITLPSIYPDAVARTLANIQAATRNEYEVLVVSPFHVEGPNVIWIEETEPRGCNFGQVMGSQKATGEFITAFADDWLYADGWDEKILPDFLERERLWDGQYLMGLRYEHWNRVGTVFGIYYANFPFMRRSNLDRYGWLGPEFKKGFGDCDLSLRVWHRGGRCEFSRERILSVTTDDSDRKTALYEQEDLELFFSRWGPIYGKGMRGDNLRDFNLDVVPENLDRVVEERTIFLNDPDSLQMLAAKGSALELIDTTVSSNIVRFCGLFYCVPKALGSLDLSNAKNRQRSEIRCYKSLAEAKAQANEIDAAVAAKAPRLIESGETINIVFFDDLFYCVPKALGPLDLNRVEERQQPGIQSYLSLSDARTAASKNNEQRRY